MILPTISKDYTTDLKHLWGCRLTLWGRAIPLRRWRWKNSPQAQWMRELAELLALTIGVTLFILATLIF